MGTKNHKWDWGFVPIIQRHACVLLVTWHPARVTFFVTATTPELHRKAIVMLLVANLLWGVSFPLIKAMALIQERLIPGSTSWYITATTLLPRFLLAALIVGVAAWSTVRTLTRKEVRQGVGLGLFGVAGIILQNDGLQYTSASTSAFLTQFYSILIPLYLTVRHGHLPSWTIWVACVLVIAGAGFLAGVDVRDFHLGRGELETIFSSFFFMGQILLLEGAEFRANRALGTTVVMFTVEAAVAAAMTAWLAPRGQSLVPLLTNVPWMTFTLMLTLLCTVAAFTLMNVWQPRISATEAGLLYSAEPLFTASMALFLPGIFSAWAGLNYPNERLTANLLAGGGLITAANLLVQLKPGKNVAA